MALKLEIGKRYNSQGHKDGRFLIIGKAPPRPAGLPQPRIPRFEEAFIGVFFGEHSTQTIRITASGSVFGSDGSSVLYTLTEEYIEPEYSYINIYKDSPIGVPVTSLVFSKENVLNSPNYHRYLHTLKLDPISGKSTVFKHDLEKFVD